MYYKTKYININTKILIIILNIKIILKKRLEKSN